MILEANARSGDYQLYHDSYSSAINTALNLARNKGYDIDEDEIFTKIGSGPRKPQPGATNNISLSLSKNERPSNEALHIQVYNRGQGNSPYELNAYIW